MKHEKITVPVTLANADVTEMSQTDQLKARSEGLFYVDDGGRREPFALALDAMTKGNAETISDAAKEIAKHFGIYKQRERNESGGKTGDYIFMVRVKCPAGGELTAAQWAALDAAADRYADGTLRLTSREGLQFHFVSGRKLAALIRHLNADCRDGGYRLTTLGACGDVNRNTMCSPIDDLDSDLPLDSRSLAHVPQHAGRQVVAQAVMSPVVARFGGEEAGRLGVKVRDRRAEVLDPSAPRRAGQIVNSIRAFVKKHAPQLELADPAKVVGRAVGLAEPMVVKHGVSLLLEPSGTAACRSSTS